MLLGLRLSISPDFINQYLQSAKEIIGERTRAEEEYDDEIVAGLEMGLPITTAVKEANRKFPSEALEIKNVPSGSCGTLRVFGRTQKDPAPSGNEVSPGNETYQR